LPIVTSATILKLFFQIRFVKEEEVTMVAVDAVMVDAEAVDADADFGQNYTGSANTTKKGPCGNLSTNMFDYGQKYASDLMRI
jgi:hypothetical protein